MCYLSEDLVELGASMGQSVSKSMDDGQLGHQINRFSYLSQQDLGFT
jgi:hypothetical protein